MKFLDTLAVLLLAGCGGGTGDDPDVTPDGGTTMTEPGGPIFLSFGTNLTTLRDAASDRLVVSAVLTDPEGVDDIIGGSLYIEGTTATLGTFATASQEGAYTIELTWTQLLTPVANNLPGWGEDFPLTIRAEFFDQAGHKATKTATVTFACETTDSTVQRVGPTKCEVGAECEGYDFGVVCTIHGEDATGAEMCQRIAGTACTECSLISGSDWDCTDPSPDDSDELSCLCE